MKTLIGLGIPENYWRKLKDLGAVSAQLRRGVSAFKDPEVIVETVKAVLGDEVEDEVEVKNHPLTIMIEPDDVMFVDRVAKKLSTTRAAIFQLIVRGILLGTVRL